MRFPVHACVMTDSLALTSGSALAPPFRSARPRCRAQRPPPVERWNPALLRRNRHAHRRRRHVALHGTPINRPRPREAVFDGSAQGSRALRARHARRARRDRRRGCALPRRRDGGRRAKARGARSPFAPMWTISCRVGPGVRCASSRMDGRRQALREGRGELWARVTRTLALDLIAPGRGAAMIDGAATFGASRSGGAFFPIAPSRELGAP